MWLSEGVEYALLTVFILGSALILWDDIKSEKNRIKLRKSLKSRKRQTRKMTEIERKIDTLLQLMPDTRLTPQIFIMGSVIIFIVCMALSGSVMGICESLIISIVFMLLPYALLRVRCELIRSDICSEGEKLVSVILTAYRINGFNISEALESAAAEHAELPGTSKIVYRLLLRLRDSSSSDEIVNVSKQFGESLNTNWGRMLSENIILAYVKGSNIALSLEEILKQLREASALMEERMRINNETVKLTVIMIPLSFVITSVLAVKQMGIPVMDLIHNQFSDEAACLMFMGIILMFIFNLSVSQLVRRKKTDL